MGLDAETTKVVPFSIVNKTYAYALEDIVLGDVADKIDFMWIDWQQGGKMGGARRASPAAHAFPSSCCCAAAAALLLRDSTAPAASCRRRDAV